jgi:hypothetical protein
MNKIIEPSSLEGAEMENFLTSYNVSCLLSTQKHRVVLFALIAIAKTGQISFNKPNDRGFNRCRLLQLICKHIRRLERDFLETDVLLMHRAVTFILMLAQLTLDPNSDFGSTY